MVNAQEWLDKNYPPTRKCIRETEDEGSDREGGWNNKGKKRAEITKLDISSQELEGDLELKGFANLEILDCSFNKNITALKIIGSPNLHFLHCSENELTELEVSDLPNLKTLSCNTNLLTELDLSQNEKLEILDIGDNNFPAQDLFFLSHLVNLHRLEMGNIMHWENANPNIYNRFSGSLEPLKNLTKLGELDIANTDLDSGLEYLPFSLNFFCCLADQSENVKVKELETKLKKFGEVGRNENFIHLLNEWRKVNCEFIFDTLQKTIEELKKENTDLEKENTELEEKNTQLEEELQMEREEAEKALEKAKEWRERQLKEITDQKDKEISELKNKISETKLQKDIQELQAAKQKFQNLSIFSFSLLGLIGLIFLLSKWRKRNQNQLGK